MNVFHKVTLEALKKNRTRTTVTIIGIALSTALSTAVTTSVSSLQHFLMTDEIERCGSYHVSMNDADPSAYQTLSANAEVKDIVYLDPIGYAMAGSENDYKPYLYLAGMSEHFTDLVSVRLISGEMPENIHEILIPEHLYSNGNVSYSVGDTLTLEVGDRMIDQHTLTQHNPYTPPEELEDEQIPERFAARETVTYTVCGIYERPAFEEFSAPGYTCLTVDADGVPSEEALALWYTVKHPSRVYDFMNEIQLQGNSHTDLLMYKGISRFDGYLAVLYGLTAILIVLIAFGSISLIYNAFSISVSERTKQFGLLSSIGATKKQLRHMVRFESFCVSIIGIPAGLVIGIVGIGITLMCVGSKFSALTESSQTMHLHASIPALVIAIVVSMLTVHLSAWIPSRRATKVSAVEAIRQSTDIRQERRPIKTPKWIYKLFGLSGMLGQKYFKRSRKKYRATVLSLFMSVVLFISSASFTTMLQNSVTSVFTKNQYDLRFYMEDCDMSTDAIRELLLADENVTSCAVTIPAYADGSMASDAFSEQAVKAEYLFGRESEIEGEVGSFLQLQFVDDTTFREYLKANGLNEADYMDPAHPQGVCVDRIITFDEEKGKYIDMNLFQCDSFDFHAKYTPLLEGYQFYGYEDDNGEIAVYRNEDGEETQLTGEEACVRRTLHIGAVLHEIPYFSDTNGVPEVYYPASVMEAVIGGTTPYERRNDANFVMIAPDHEAAVQSLHTTFIEHHLPLSHLYDVTADHENEHNLIVIIRVFSLGFIVLISLIAVANVFNSISTNVALRRREFAMLRSIGMTSRGLQKMMNFECILYGTRALMFGLPVSAAMSLLIWYTIHHGLESGYQFPWQAMCFAIFSVFAVVFITMLYAMSKIYHDNPMDALKNDNL